MKKNRIYKYVGSSLLALLLLLMMVLLNLSVQKNTTINNENNAKVNQQTKLNVAIVNEDKPVYVDTKEYNLGASYVKNIERDNSQNWSVVPRGAADTGLESGKYQLVLTIPSDFSEKILDINSINVDKTTINYKVNAQGNLQVENDANKLAKDIVSDLNGQLVDMYMASILNNLYTAQKNVQASSQIQATNIGNYRTNLYNTAINSKNLFPTLYSMSSSSVDANSALKTGLEGYSQIFGRYDVSQIAYGKKLDTLLQDRVTEKKNHADVITGLISQSREDVKGQIETYKELIKAQGNLTSNIDGTAASSDGTSSEVVPSYKKVAENIKKEIDSLQNNLTDERTKFENHKKDIHNFIDEKLATYYGTSEKSKITLKQFLDTAANKDLEKAVESLKEQLASAISELPKEDFSGKEFSGFGMTPITIPSVNYTELKTIKEPSDEINSTDLKNLEDLAISSTSAVGRTGTKAKVSWKAGTGVTVHSVTYDGTPVEFGQEIDLKTGGTFKVAYSLAEAAPAPTPIPIPTTDSTGGPSPTPKAEPETVDISLNDVQAVSAPIDVLAVQQAAVTYGQKVQKIASAYQKVESLKKAYDTVRGLKNSDVSTALSDIWFEAISSNLKKYEDSLTAPASDKDKDGAKEKVDKALSELTTLKPVLEKNVQDVLTTNQELNKKIKKQLELYEQLEGKLKDLVEKQGKGNDAFGETNNQLATLNTDYAALLSETKGVKESSQSNVKAAESVNETLGNFNRELSNAQTNTEKLSQDADSLMTQFNEELSKNGNFVESFVKVLNNAYDNGVPNEVLLNFLSNPVAQNSTSVKATVNVYRPFTWILLLEIVSLFTGYLFATQNIVRKVKDKFKLDKLHDTDIMTVGLLSILAIIVGLVVGIVSSAQLHVGREYQPSWVLLIVLAALVLIQGQYLLLKHFRVIGMGLAFFMMISFVYLSNAIGTTASLTGFPAFIKNLNALSILEAFLSGYFDGQPANILAFIAMMIVVAGLLVMNIFIKERRFWPQVFQTEKE